MLHRLSAVSCTHRTPAGLPSSMPGIGEEMDMAIQHAAQPVLHSKVIPPSNSRILMHRCHSRFTQVQVRASPWAILRFMARLAKYPP